VSERCAPRAGEDKDIILVGHMGTDVTAKHVGDEPRHIDPPSRPSGLWFAEVEGTTVLGERLSDVKLRLLDDGTRRTPREHRSKRLPSRGFRPAGTSTRGLVSQRVPEVTSRSLQIRSGVAPDPAISL